MKDNKIAAGLPLIALQPVMDGRHCWVAILLEAQAPLNCEEVSLLFGELGLGEGLAELPCIVAMGDPAGCVDAGMAIPGQIVLRLPVAACTDTDDCARLNRLREKGFRLMAEGLPAAGRELCPDVTAVALAASEVDPQALVGFLARRQGEHLALGVDSYEQLRRCRERGFAWFAGNYPLHPEPGHPPRNATRHTLLLQLLTLITHDASSHDIETLIKEDAQLSYQLLRLVNSVAFSLDRKISSFGQAIAVLGMRQLQRWLQLLLYARPDGNECSTLLPRAALRAALVEALCQDQPAELREQAFMAGMFSLLDRILGISLQEILVPLKLPDTVTEALLDRSGPLGKHLRIAEIAEQGCGDTLGAALAGAGIDNVTWADALIRAYHWAIRVSREA